MAMEFKLLGLVQHAETIATGGAIRELRRLRRAYGGTQWRKRKGLATVQFEDGTTRTAVRLRPMPRKLSGPYVVCISNEGYRVSLEPRKIYVSIADLDAKKLGLVRVIDESGEDFLFPRDRFVSLALPRRIAAAISEAAAHA